MVAVLFVCMGNICRSPLAEGVFRQLAEPTGLVDRYRGGIIVDSAGTTGYHTGQEPDRRAQAVARDAGFDISRLRSRQVRMQDFHDFDYILAMDRENIANLARLAPEGFADKPRLFLEFADNAPLKEVPDPYYGEADGFGRTLDLVRRGAEGLLRDIIARHYPDQPVR